MGPELRVRRTGGENRVNHPEIIEDLERARLDALAARTLEGAAAASIRRNEIPRRARSSASVNPVGPAPTINTVVSYIVRIYLMVQCTNVKKKSALEP